MCGITRVTSVKFRRSCIGLLCTVGRRRRLTPDRAVTTDRLMDNPSTDQRAKLDDEVLRGMQDTSYADTASARTVAILTVAKALFLIALELRGLRTDLRRSAR